MKLSTRYQLLLVCLIPLIAYYPVLSAGYNPVDDIKMLSAWMDRDLGDLWHYFFRKGGYHYRPLVGITFFLDNLLWGLDPSFMHLENILLHCASGLLLFAVVRRLFIICSWEPGYYPLVASLFFLLHPINTEAVSWISGRFDLFAGFLVLCSLIVLLSGVPAGKLSRVFVASVIFFLACLAKESAIFFFGGAFLLIFFLSRRRAPNNVKAVFASIPSWLILSGSALLYFVYRHFALSGRDSGIGAVTGTAATAENVFEVFDKARITFKVMGYYLKKLFVPVPLNYAIINVYEAYVLLGVLLLLLVIYLLRKVWCCNDLTAIMFLSASGMTLAGLIVALGKMAWTPVAERYMYMPSMFFVVGMTLLVRHCLSQNVVPSLVRPMVGTLLIIFMVLTLHRSWVWSDPIRFLEDTVEKSPEFYFVRSDLAFKYFQKGDVEKARQMYADIRKEVGVAPYANADINDAIILSEEGSFVAARDLLHSRLQNPGKKLTKIAETLIMINNKYLATITDKSAKYELLQENLGLLLRMSETTQDPFLKYRLAKAYLALDQPQESCLNFQKAYEEAPVGSYYRVPAGKLADKLCKKQHD